MGKKIFTFPAFIVLALAIVSVIAIAVQIFGPVWSNGLPIISIVKGQSATFSVDLGAVNPPISYSVDLYDTMTNQFVGNVKSATSNAQAFTDTITVSPANYNNLGRTYRVQITAYDSAGINAFDESLTLIVTQQAPVVSNIPDVTMNAGDSLQAFDLDNYVTDADDPISSMTWSVTGNDTNVSVSIDAQNLVTINANSSFTGAQTLTFTATDPSGASSSDNVVVTVNPAGTILPSTLTKDVTVHNLNLEVVDGNYLLIRNRGSRLEDLRVTFDLEATGSTEQIFRMDLNRNTVTYKKLDVESINPGTYLARIEVQSSNDDFDESGYLVADLG